MTRALPEQHRVQLALGLSSGPISAPSKETLLTALRQKDQDETAAQASAQQPAASSTVEIPENGSLPIPVTAPIPDDEKDNTDAVRVETPQQNGEQTNVQQTSQEKEP